MLRYLILRKSVQPSLFEITQPHHVGYTRVNRRGTASTIKQLGNNSHQQLGLNFTAEPKQKTIADITRNDVSFQGFIDNGKNILEFLTGGRSKEDRSEEKKKLKAETEAAWKRYEDAVKKYASDFKTWTQKQQVPEVAQAYSDYNKIYEGKLKASRESGQEEYEKVMEWLTKDSDTKACLKVAKSVASSNLTKKQISAMADCYSIIGTDTTSTLWDAYSTHKNGRANASKQEKSITLAPDDSAKTIYHEMAHHVEFSHNEINRAAKEFRFEKASRKGGSLNAVPLNQLIPGSTYRADEKAVKDKFVTPYVGKLYGDGSTEVISMGLQHFSSKSHFIKLLDKDPEHAHFMIGVLHHLRTKRGLQ